YMLVDCINVVTSSDDNINIMENAKKINFQSPIKNQFLKFVGEHRSWCISRTRHFGNFIPIVRNKQTNKLITFDSLSSLNNFFEDVCFQSHHIQDIVNVSEHCNGYEFYPFAFDCWFESACMVLFTNGYHMFENIFEGR